MSDDIRHRSLAADLAEQASAVSGGVEQRLASERLAALEQEHQELSRRRRRLHETIDLLDKQAVLKPEIAALLVRYRRAERDISWRRRDIYRLIEELRVEEHQAGQESSVS